MKSQESKCYFWRTFLYERSQWKHSHDRTSTVLNTCAEIPIWKSETSSASWRSTSLQHRLDNKPSSQGSVLQHSNTQWKITGQNTNPMRCQKTQLLTSSSLKLPRKAEQDITYHFLRCSPRFSIQAHRQLESVLCTRSGSFSSFSEHNLLSLIFLCAS